MKVRHNLRIYTDQHLFELALKHKLRNEMKKAFGLEYQALVRRKLLTEAFKAHFNDGYINAPRGYWNKERNVLEEAKKYPTKSEFQDNAYQAWFSARRNGWLDACYKHMTVIGSLTKRAVYRLINEQTKTVYIGLTCNIKKRMISHKSDCKKEIFLIGGSINFEIISDDYIPLDDAIKLEKEEIRKYREDDDYEVINVRDGGEVGSCGSGISEVELLHIIFENNLNTSKKLQRYSIYCTVLDRGLMPKLYKMYGESFYKTKPNGYWRKNKELIRELSATFDYVEDFRKAFGGACSAMYKEGWHKEFYPDVRENITLSDCKKVALNCRNVTQFKQDEHRYWYICLNEGWLDKMKYTYKKPAKRPPAHFSIDIIPLLKQCKTFSELENINSPMHSWFYGKKEKGESRRNEYKQYLAV